MSEAYMFPSKEWAEKFCKLLSENIKYKDSAKKWEGSILFIASNLPEYIMKIYNGKDKIAFLLDLWHGECRGSTWYEDVDENAGEYALDASYEDWIKIIEGKLDPIKAMITKKMKVKKGSIATIMRFTLAAINMVKTAQQVPTKT